MDRPILKPNNSILVKSSFLRTVKYNNLAPSDLSVYMNNNQHDVTMIQKKDREKRKGKKKVLP
jgi:hypothetical protein